MSLLRLLNLTDEPDSAGDYALQTALDPMNLALLALAAKRRFAPKILRASPPPSHPGGIEKLGVPSHGPGADWDTHEKLIKSVSGSPDMKAILAEVPPGSKYLGHGRSSVAYETPDGDILKISVLGEGHPVDIEEVLQPTYYQSYRGPRLAFNKISVTRMPKVDPSMMGMDELAQFEAGIRAKGKRPVDLGPARGERPAHNIGMLGDRPVVFDAGAVIDPYARPATNPYPYRYADPHLGRLLGLGIAYNALTGSMAEAR